MSEDLKPLEAIAIVCVSIFIAVMVSKQQFPNYYERNIVKAFQKAQAVFQGKRYKESFYCSECTFEETLTDRNAPVEGDK